MISLTPVVKLDNFDQLPHCTLKFFKNGAEKEDGVKYHGNWDLASLQKFIKEKLGETDELAKKLESDTKVKIAKLDSTQAQGVCQENKVRGLSTFPYFR